MRDDKILKRLNKLNSDDLMVQDVIKAIGAEMDRTDSAGDRIRTDMIFQTCSEEMVRFWEEKMQIVPKPGQDLDGRRATIEARWKATGKVNVELLQEVADSWKYGKVDVKFNTGNKIEITFNDTLGIPKDTEGLKDALEEVKPAHIPIIFIAIYLYVRDVNALTIRELQSHKIGDFAF